MAVTFMKKMKNGALRRLHSNKPFFDIWVGCVACFFFLSAPMVALNIIYSNNYLNVVHLLIPYHEETALPLYIFVFLLFSILSRLLRCCYFRINPMTFTDGDENFDCLLEGLGINRDGVDQWDMDMVSLVSGHVMDHQNPSSLVHSEDMV